MNRKKLSVLVISLLLLAELSFSAALPVPSWAESGTHYIAIASDRHNETSAISEAMSGMPGSVEYVCLNGDMTNFDRPPRPQNEEQSGTSDNADQGAPEAGLTDRPARRAAKQLPYNTSDVLSEVQSVFPALTADNVSIIYASHDSNATDDADITGGSDDNDHCQIQK